MTCYFMSYGQLDLNVSSRKFAYVSAKYSLTIKDVTRNAVYCNFSNRLALNAFTNLMSEVRTRPRMEAILHYLQM